MKIKHKATLLLIFLVNLNYAQNGINTVSPKGELDIVTTKNLGLVVPRVTSLAAVNSGNNNPPIDGTVVFETTLGKLCFYTEQKWICLGVDTSGNPSLTNETPSGFDTNTAITYVKASNTNVNDFFGDKIDISGDGNTLVVTSSGEASGSTGVNANQTDNSAPNSGAIYVFVKSGNSWVQQAYIKPLVVNQNDFFGASVAISTDGNTIAVGATGESSNATSINGDANNNSNPRSGAVYVFTRTGTTWNQEAFIKATNSEANDSFGVDVALSDDGNTLAVGANEEDGNATGVNGSQGNGILDSGAAYVFTRSGINWSQQAYLKASNTGSSDLFGIVVDLSGDGSTLAIAASLEESGSSGINANQNDNSLTAAGAVYVFTSSGGSWSQQAYIKASNPDNEDRFGSSLGLSFNGNTLAVGAYFESSDATTINGAENNNNSPNSGAVYVFERTVNIWSQQTYLKASNADESDQFGSPIAISNDGNTLAISAFVEDGSSTGIGGNLSDNAAPDSGAVYIFLRSGNTWSQDSYIKASNTENSDFFGWSIALSSFAQHLVVGSFLEDSNAIGINGNQNDNSASNAGAVHIYETN